MDDSGRLILGASFDAEDVVRSGSNSSQTINTSTPADIENLAAHDVSLPADGTVAEYRVSGGTDTDPLVLPVSVCIIDDQLVSVSLDTRLASGRRRVDEIGGQLDPQFSMTSQLRTIDTHFTIVDMTGQQPGVHHLLQEGGSGFITYENGDRILII